MAYAELLSLLALRPAGTRSDRNTTQSGRVRDVVDRSRLRARALAG
jgi:hypothetical protein